MKHSEVLSIEANEILTLANQIKTEQKEAAKVREIERQQKVIDLLDTIAELHPEKSNSIFKELFKIAKAKDFKETFVYLIAGTVNVCSYDGKELVTFKQNGEISVNNLPFRKFVELFGADFRNMPKFSKGVIRSEFLESETNLMSSSSECFESWKTAFIERVKTSGNYDTNLGSIYKKKLEILALTTKNKTLKKPYSGKAKK